MDDLLLHVIDDLSDPERRSALVASAARRQALLFELGSLDALLAERKGQADAEEIERIEERALEVEFLLGMGP
jgi:hypothetical protein